VSAPSAAWTRSDGIAGGYAPWLAAVNRRERVSGPARRALPRSPRQ
jgi:hypothetical protein